MKEIKDYKMIILGNDQGNGNQKTAHRIILSGVEPLVGEAIASNNVLTYKGKNYVIGESHLTYREIKTDTDDFFLLNLAAIAEELDYRGYTEANILLAVGLPLAWVKAKQKAYREYLSREEDLEYIYKGKEYHVHIGKVMVFPQGLAAMAEIGDVQGETMLLDIGNGTTDIARFEDGVPIEKSLSTEEYGVSFCVREIQQEISRALGKNVEERRIEKLLRSGCEDATDEVANITKQIATKYAEELIRRVKVVGYEPSYMKLFIIGGGGCILKHFSNLSIQSNVAINDDIHINAKGYEYFAKLKLQAGK